MLDATAQHPAAQQERVDLQASSAARRRSARRPGRSRRTGRSPPPPGIPGPTRPAGRISPSLRRAVVKLNWLVRCVSCATRSICSGAGSAIVICRSRPARNSSMVVACFWKRPRSASCRYIAVRCRSSAVTRGRSNAQTCRRNPSMSPSTGSRSDRTSGQAEPTSAHSTGLSSRKMKLSSPRFSSRASARMFSDLRPPVDPPGDQVLPLQDHVRPAVEDLQDVGLVVLAAQAEQEPLARQLGHEPLEALPGRRDRDARRPRPRRRPPSRGCCRSPGRRPCGAGAAGRGSDGPGASPSRRRTAACRGCGPSRSRRGSW